MGAYHTGCSYLVFAESLKSCLTSSKRKRERKKKYTDQHESWIWPTLSLSKLSLSQCLLASWIFGHLQGLWNPRESPGKGITSSKSTTCILGLGTWVSLSWQVLCVNLCREGCSGLFPTMDIHFSTWGSSNVRLRPSGVVMGWHSSHILFVLKSISSRQNYPWECLLKSFVYFFSGETVFTVGHGAVPL